MGFFEDIANEIEKEKKLARSYILPKVVSDYNNRIKLCNVMISSILEIAKDKKILTKNFTWVNYLNDNRKVGLVVVGSVGDDKKSVCGSNVVETSKSIIFVPGEEDNSVSKYDKLIYGFTVDRGLTYRFGHMCYLREIKIGGFDPLSHVSIDVLGDILNGLKEIEAELTKS